MGAPPSLMCQHNRRHTFRMDNSSLGFFLFAVVAFANVAGILGNAPQALAKPAEDQLNIDSHYILVIDAGSSGSRVHVYKYHWAVGDRFPTFVLPDARLKTKPGLSTFAEHPADAGPSLKGLMDFAAEHVPVPLRANTPVILSATAGLRLVTPLQAERVLESCYTWLKANTGFKIDQKLIAVISGQQEGAYGWLTINFLSQRLAGMALAANGTVGCIEVGGASTQVTLPVLDGISGRDEGFFDLRLGDLKIPLYAHSYLGYGLEEARSAYNDKVKDKDRDPCFPVGYTKDKSLQYDVFHGREEGAVIGTGDYEACREGVKPLFSQSATCHQPPCSFNGIHQPPISTWPQMVAFENFYHAASGVSVSHLEKGVSAKDLMEAGQKFCSHTWDEIQQHKLNNLYPNMEENNKYRYCFAMAYLPALLTDGLHLPSSQPFYVWGTVQGTPIEWSLGQALKAIEDGLVESANLGPNGSSTEQTIWWAGGMFAVFAVLFAISQIRASRARSANYEMMAQEASYEDADLEAGMSPKVTAQPVREPRIGSRPPAFPPTNVKRTR